MSVGQTSPKASTTPGKGGGIQSLERAAAILDAVAARPDGVGLGELASTVGLHTSTAFHLLKTLVHLGFVSQDADTRSYRIGSRLFALAAGAMNDNSLLLFGTPVLERLSAETGEAAHLAVRSASDITLIARTAATGMLQMSERAGVSRPAHATAIGKMLISRLDAADLDAFLADYELTAITENTITDPKALRRELDDIRQAGVAHDRGELDVDVHCAAMPVHDFAGRCVAAIGISGPVWRMSADALAPKIVRLRAAAAGLSEQLGFRDLDE